MMFLFPLFFVVVCVDFTLNGPGSKTTDRGETQKRMLMLVPMALASVVMNNVVMYLVSQGVMLTIALMDLYREYVTKHLSLRLVSADDDDDDDALVAKSEEGKGDDQHIPDSVHQLLDECLDAFEKNLDPNQNYVGKEWKIAKDEAHIQILQSSFPGKSCKWWKIETNVHTSLDVFVEEVLDINKRCKWDPSLKRGEVLHEYTPDEPRFKPDDRVMLSRYFTESGPVSSRELVNLGLLRWHNDKKSLTYINTSFDPTILGNVKGKIPETKDGVRAQTFPGGGIRVEIDDENPGQLKFVMISAIDVKLGVLAGMANTFIPGALFETSTAMRSHLESKEENSSFDISKTQ